jgi:predicted MFS family arabinose efflux permease
MVDQVTGPGVSVAPGVSEQSAPRAGYILLVLYLACVFSYVDRQLIALLAPAIQRDLQLSDTQLGFVSGTAFAVLYVVIGIPLAQLSDRVNRVRMLSVALVAWSAMTALCGAAGSFVQLALCRVGVAVGEAGGYPASLSIISDLFPQRRRASAAAIFLSGTTAGALVSLVIGGMLNEVIGWRATFVIAGAPGLLLAALLILTVREPTRGAMDGVAAPAKAESFFGSFRVLFSQPLYRKLALASAIYNLELFSLAAWAPTYAVRTFKLGTAQVGLGLGLALGIGSSFVMIAGGRMADSLSRRSIAAPVFISATGQLLMIPFFLAAMHAHSFALFCVLHSIAYGCSAIGGPMNVAAAHAVTPPHVRGAAASLLVMIATLAGYGLGPPLIGAFSDLLGSGAPAERLRTALQAGVGFNAIAAVILIWGGWRLVRPSRARG